MFIANFLISVALTIGILTATFNTAEVTVKADKNLYDFTLKSLDGKPINLASFKGKKVMLVNVASKCGYTPQYAKLQKFHEKYGSKVVLIGIPANNFGGQEPGTATEIKEFCTKNYGVTFLMAEKLSVKGDDAAPLYKWLTASTEAPSWNFCKYLINEKGEVVKFFKSSVDPMGDEIAKSL